MAIRIFTGTIPDYSSEVDGLLLSGVMAGGPAETGRVFGRATSSSSWPGTRSPTSTTTPSPWIVLKVGEPASVVFMRGDERIETELIPEARQ